MIDMFALLLTHGLLFIALFRLMSDDTVDEDPAFAEPGSTEPAEAPKTGGSTRA